MITPFPAGGLFNRSTMNAKLEEIGGAITEASWQLIEVLDNTGSMSGTWTAPDFFGDGSAYDLGVYEIGGGGSGCNTQTDLAQGGASGYGKNFIINNVVPGTQYPYVIGAGGTGATLDNDGNAGGTTSFNNVEAEGGGGGCGNSNLSRANGGQGSDYVSYNYGASPRKLYGCCPTMNYSNNGGTTMQGFHGTSQSSREGQNQFDPNMVSLCAGGCAHYNTSFAQVISPMPNGTKGGDGRTSGTGESATGYGNGGGAISYAKNTATSGSGSDGAIYLYARRPQEVTT